MVRIIEGMGKNSSQEYDRIYLKRKERGVDAFDLKRWKRLLKYYRGGKLLDAGCLDSLVCSLALEQYPAAEVWGMDIAEKTIQSMRERFPNVYWQVGDIYDTKIPNNYFDYIVLGEVIEHLDEPSKAIREIMRILKHGGILALSTPEDEAKELGAVDKERHIWSFKIEDVKKLLDPWGIVWIKRMGSQFFPQYIYHWPNIVAYCKKR